MLPLLRAQNLVSLDHVANPGSILRGHEHGQGRDPRHLGQPEKMISSIGGKRSRTIAESADNLAEYLWLQGVLEQLRVIGAWKRS